MINENDAESSTESVACDTLNSRNNTQFNIDDPMINVLDSDCSNAFPSELVPHELNAIPEQGEMNFSKKIVSDLLEEILEAIDTSKCTELETIPEHIETSGKF